MNGPLFIFIISHSVSKSLMLQYKEVWWIERSGKYYFHIWRSCLEEKGIITVE